MSSDQFNAAKARLQRILRRVGWTLHLRHQSSGWYAYAAKRDETSHWHGAYIAPLYRVNEMTTDKIVSVLPDVA